MLRAPAMEEKTRVNDRHVIVLAFIIETVFLESLKAIRNTFKHKFMRNIEAWTRPLVGSDEPSSIYWGPHVANHGIFNAVHCNGLS